MTISSREKFLSYLDVIGAIAMYLYVFTNYVAQDIIISSYVNSVFLYTFLGLVLFKTCLTFRELPRMSRFTLWYILFAIFSFIVMLYSPEFKLFDGAFYGILITLALIYSFQLYVTSENGFRCLAWCYSASGFATILMLLVTGNFHGDAGDRLGQTTFGNANIFASLMMVAAMYTLWLVVYTKGLQRILPALFFLADIYALALSGGRKFFVIPFIFLYFLFLFKRDRRGRIHVVRVTLIFAALGLAVLIAIMKVPVLYNSIGVRVEGLIRNFLGSGKEYSAMIRRDLRQAAMEEWKKSPLFGYGLDSFKYFARDNLDHFYYSHCNYTELLYSGGIAYFALYYAMFAKILIEAFRKKTLASSFRAFAITVPICLFIFDYGAVSFNTPHNLVMLMLACKCLTFESVDEIKEDSRGPVRERLAKLFQRSASSSSK